MASKINFWQQVHKPIFILAPMEEVTDTVFRQVVAFCGKPDVFFTEFTNVEGLQSRGRDKVIHRLQFTENQHQIVAQIWGLKPENFLKTAKEIVAMGFDGIDINMGCPERNVMKRGSCAALIDNPNLAKEMIQATKEGAGNLPVSVKTRIGTKQIATEDWVGFLLEQNVAAITIHARTAKEMSAVPAHWEEIAKAVKLRDQLKIDTLIVGNGDIKSRAEALEKVEQFGVDGIMIGRGIFENPWLFNKTTDMQQVTTNQRLELLLKHAKLFENTWGRTKNFAILRRFFKIYASGFDGASDLRAELMQTNNYAEVEAIIKPSLQSHISAV